MKKRLKKLPKFKTEGEEREFWDTHDSTDYIDWSKAKIGRFPNLKLTNWDLVNKSRHNPIKSGRTL